MAGVFKTAKCFHRRHTHISFASAAIPLAFEAQGVGWKGLLSRAGVDGCVAGELIVYAGIVSF